MISFHSKSISRFTLEAKPSNNKEDKDDHNKRRKPTPTPTPESVLSTTLYSVSSKHGSLRETLPRTDAMHNKIKYKCVSDQMYFTPLQAERTNEALMCNFYRLL